MQFGLPWRRPTLFSQPSTAQTLSFSIWKKNKQEKQLKICQHLQTFEKSSSKSSWLTWFAISFLRLCLLVIAQITKNFCFTSCQQLSWSCCFICQSPSKPLCCAVVQHWLMSEPSLQFPQQKYFNKSSSNHLSRLNWTHIINPWISITIYITIIPCTHHLLLR